MRFTHRSLVMRLGCIITLLLFVVSTDLPKVLSKENFAALTTASVLLHESSDKVLSTQATNLLLRKQGERRTRSDTQELLNTSTWPENKQTSPPQKQNESALVALPIYLSVVAPSHDRLAWQVSGRDTGAPRELFLWEEHEGRYARVAKGFSAKDGQLYFSEVLLSQRGLTLIAAPKGARPNSKAASEPLRIAPEPNRLPQVQVLSISEDRLMLRVWSPPGTRLHLTSDPGVEGRRIVVPESLLQSAFDLSLSRSDYKNILWVRAENHFEAPPVWQAIELAQEEEAHGELAEAL